ncbi:MAG TPA: acyltransferase family protein [Flavobacterium sp.]
MEDEILKNKNHDRLNWVDQVKGFTIFLVVYGHNFPAIEKYIYSFHMPLFIMIAGFFHPAASRFENVGKRFKAIIIPYFIWSFLLFAFWFVASRHYGDSAALNLSPVKNFIGIFYSQGDRQYMDWGIPLWFLPAIFVTFLLFHFIKKIPNENLQYTFVAIVSTLGLIYPHLTKINLPWSINIAMVGLLFYAFGSIVFKKIESVSKKQLVILMIFMGLTNACLYNLNIKVDMYRAVYGNGLLFVLSAFTGSLFILFVFKAFPIFKFFELLGKFSLTILALQLVAMTFIKFVLMTASNNTDFNFSELEKFLYSILQIILMLPAFFIINKYLPILNGGYKKI